MSVPGIAVPGTVVPVSSLVSPGGSQGVSGLSAYSTTAGAFTVPAVGSTATVTLADTSWVTNGEFVYMAGAGGSGQGAILQVTAISGNQLTLLNPTPPPALPPPASTSTAGLLNQLSGAATDYVGGDNACHPMAQVQGAFFSKTANYAVLAPADIGKYFICTGGSWTLTLPAGAQSGFWFRVRNDMGLTGTTGMITISPSTGTIDGLASQTLCAGQDCTIITDGTNWRTLERQREVVIGVYKVASPLASIPLQLPIGYTEFELSITQLQISSNGGNLQCQLSTDGGNTWLGGTAYWGAYSYNSSATAWGTASYNAGAMWYLTHWIESANPRHYVRINLNPGDGTEDPLFIGHSTMYAVAGYTGQFFLSGFYNGGIRANAILLFPNAGTISPGTTIIVKGRL